jgi:hypothetical protein
LLANHTEFGFLVGAHTAVLVSTPNTLAKVSAALDETGFSFANQILPFAGEIVLCGEIRLPRLGICKVHRIVIAIGILVAKSSEGVSELVNYHGTEIRSVGIGEVIGIIDSTATIMVCVYQYYNMFVRSACQHIVQPLKVQRC